MMYDAGCRMHDALCMMHDVITIPLMEVNQAYKLGRLDKKEKKKPTNKLTD